ncbi:MAG: dihydroorotate dehydrogenase electron transfer subunit [Archaeoglobaceae archaeon]|nr:dihydroorotate dehydrogenase electron transfer subunit [Archaeoglobaceae archaeon]
MFTVKIVEIVRHSKNIATLYFNKKIPSFPGQFVMFNVFGYEEIPLSLSSENSVTVKAVGDTTKAIVQENIKLAGIRGAFGNPFTLSDNSLIIAGGIGMAPLKYLYDSLKKEGCATKVVYGAKSSDELIWVNELENASFATEDGSFGIKGTVLDLLRGMEFEKFNKIYCCGKEDMLKEIYRLLKAKNCLNKAEFSLERYMRCGLGICGSCVLNNGLRVCRDGPVFKAKSLERIL